SFSTPRPPTSPLLPYTTLFRSLEASCAASARAAPQGQRPRPARSRVDAGVEFAVLAAGVAAARKVGEQRSVERATAERRIELRGDRKSTRLNSSHVKISYAVFC